MLGVQGRAGVLPAAQCSISGARVAPPTLRHKGALKNHQCRATRSDVVVTREAGKNGELMRALEARGLNVLEMPLLETVEGPDTSALPSALAETPFGWVAITSPEAAAVFLKAWVGAGKPKVHLAAVGAGTARVLEEAGLQVAYLPTKANATSLAAELPETENALVLYPSSAKAGSDLQEGLRQRGFEVVRLNTYNTVAVTTVPEDKLSMARHAAVAAFASPSAVKAWAALTGGPSSTSPAIACIGSTSSRAAKELGYQDVFYPEFPGLDGFVDAITQALAARRHSTAA